MGGQVRDPWHLHILLPALTGGVLAENNLFLRSQARVL